MDTTEVVEREGAQRAGGSRSITETGGVTGPFGLPLGRGSALSRLGAELELRRSGSSLGPSQ